MTNYLEELFRRQGSARRPEMPVSEAGAHGRFGDTLLAHISQNEARKLKQEGGSGTRNPATGLLEFFDAGDAGGPGPGEGGMGGGPGGAGPGQGGASGPGAAGGGAGGAAGGGERGGPRSGPGVAGTDVGGAVGSGAAPGPGAGTGAGGNPGGTSDTGGGNVGSDPASLGGSPGAAPETETEKSFFDSLLDTLENVDFKDFAESFLGVMSAIGVPGLSAVAGPIGLASQAHDVARGLGEVATGLGIAGDPGPLDPDDPSAGVGPADPGAVTGSDPAAFGGKGGAAGGALGGGQITDPPPPIPEREQIPVLEEPASLRLSSAMTPLQKRATIATFGTGAESGRFREPDVQNFYKNFLLRDLLSKPDAPFLPVEAQFANQVLGLDVSQDTPRSELLTLLGNPAEPQQPLPPATPQRVAAEGAIPGQRRYA